MSYRALVVDDNRGVLDTVSDVLRSLGHEYDLATCQEEARALLAKHQYDYHLLDLEIPVSPERCLARIENGVNLVREVAERRNGRPEPIIVMTGHGTDGPGLGVRVMKLGANDFINKPFDHTLDAAILEALEKAKAKRQKDTVSPPPTESRDFRGGKMVFWPDRIELCGVTIVEGPVRIRQILEVLRKRRMTGKFIAFSGAKLAAMLEIVNGQNAVAEAVKDFRDHVEEVLAAHHIRCGRQDIIRSGGPGYRLADWIEVWAGSPKADP